MSNTPESDEAWDAVSRDAGGLYSSITPMKDYAYAMLEKSKELERERDEARRERDALIEACKWAQVELGKHTRPSPIDIALAALKGGNQ